MTKSETVQINITDALNNSGSSLVQSTNERVTLRNGIVKSVVVNADLQQREALIRRVNGKSENQSTIVRELIAG